MSVDLQERTSSLPHPYFPAVHRDSLKCCSSPVRPVIRGWVLIPFPLYPLTPALEKKKCLSKGTQAAGTEDFWAGPRSLECSVDRLSSRGGPVSVCTCLVSSPASMGLLGRSEDELIGQGREGPHLRQEIDQQRQE